MADEMVFYFLFRVTLISGKSLFLGSILCAEFNVVLLTLSIYSTTYKNTFPAGSLTCTMCLSARVVCLCAVTNNSWGLFKAYAPSVLNHVSTAEVWIIWNSKLSELNWKHGLCCHFQYSSSLWLKTQECSKQNIHEVLHGPEHYITVGVFNKGLLACS